MSVRHLYVGAVAAIMGCASASNTSNMQDLSGKPRTSTILTAEEIGAAHADNATAYDALARLRPNWLAAHGGMSSDPNVSPFATVFLDGQLYGEISSLRNIPAYYVGEAHYHDVTQAGARFGVQGGTGGVIEIKTRDPR